MLHVRLRPDWKATFQRTIARDEKGKSIEVRVFAPGEIVKIPPQELPFLAFDIGKALQPMEWSDEFGKYRPIDVKELDLDGLVKSIQDGTYVEEGATFPVIEPHDGAFLLVDYDDDEPSYAGVSLKFTDEIPADPFPTEAAASAALQGLLAAKV